MLNLKCETHFFLFSFSFFWFFDFFFVLKKEEEEKTVFPVASRNRVLKSRSLLPFSFSFVTLFPFSR